jgi:hypothetical protein
MARLFPWLVASNSYNGFIGFDLCLPLGCYVHLFEFIRHNFGIALSLVYRCLCVVGCNLLEVLVVGGRMLGLHLVGGLPTAFPLIAGSHILLLPRLVGKIVRFLLPLQLSQCISPAFGIHLNLKVGGRN